MPIKTLGDGNCLYRAISILCIGNETLYTELRARTTCELVIHSDFYLCSDKCSCLAFDGTLIKDVLALSSLNCPHTANADICKTAFQLDCLESSVMGTWANMWHVYRLASVLGRQILSVYPDFNETKQMRPAFNCCVQPRMHKSYENTVSNFTVMWSRIGPPLQRGKWVLNHFVACIPLSMVSKQVHPEWVKIVKKRHKSPVSISLSSFHFSNYLFIQQI